MEILEEWNQVCGFISSNSNSNLQLSAAELETADSSKCRLCWLLGAPLPWAQCVKCAFAAIASYWLLVYMRSAKLGLCWYCRVLLGTAAPRLLPQVSPRKMGTWFYSIIITKCRGQTGVSSVLSTNLLLVLVGWRCEFETIQTSLQEILTNSKYWNEIYICCRRLHLTNILILESKNVSLFMSSKFSEQSWLNILRNSVFSNFSREMES